MFPCVDFATITIEFTKHVIQLPPIFGRFYYALMNEFTHPFIHKVYTPAHVVSKKSSEWPISVDSANQNCDYIYSVINPVKPKLEKIWRSDKEQFIRFATFLWIISSFCVDILTICLTAFINKVIILVHIVRLTLSAFLV